jgi:hypothetical protein
VPRSIRPLLTLCALALLVPAAAQAQAPAPTMIDGSPLNVWASADGGVQANVDGYTRSEWFPYVTFDPTTSGEAPSPNANAGFGLVVNPGNPNGSPRFGRFIAGGLPAPTSGPTLTPGDPATITATWTLSDFSGDQLIELTQVLSYTNGSRQFDATYTVKNVSSVALTFRATVAGDMAIRGSDTGIGFLSPGPPRFVGGLNQEVGAAGGFVEETPGWSHYEVGQYGTVGQHAGDTTAAGGLDDTLNTEQVDNGAGVEWDDHLAAENALAPGAEAVYKVGQKFIDTLGLTPPADQKLTGDQAVLTATVGDLNGNPATANQTINYTVQGSNNLSGKVQTGNDGKATISYVGGAGGTDTITAFVDANGNDTRDLNEAQAVATIEWTGPPAPVIGTSADVRVVGKGTVKVKLPPGTSLAKAKRLGLQGAATGFVKLTSATQIPMGSTLDTSKGTVNLLSAGSKDSFSGKFNSGNFNGGQFKLTQSKKNPLTQLSMQGGKLKGCNTRVPRGGAARTRSRRLFGSAHGRFRTRGRNSSATVRGTKWTMTDTCAGTLTSVKSGTVVVRDFRLHKNKKVKAGHKYFARATKLRRVKK